MEHEGQKELTVYAVGTRYTVDFGAMSKEMGRVLEENVVDKGLRDWIIPDFSTSTENDRVVSSVIMMVSKTQVIVRAVTDSSNENRPHCRNIFFILSACCVGSHPSDCLAKRPTGKSYSRKSTS